MENTSQSSENEVIKIDISCLQESHIEHDMESEFKYWNSHFLVSALVLVIIFGIQLYYGLPEGNDIDMSNFTYKFSNYKEGGNNFGIFTGMFLHGSFSHLISNLIFLYPFTLITSSKLQHPIFISVIFITGIIAGQASGVLNDLPSLGASGWIFGIFGFLTPYYLYNKKTLSSNVQDIPWVFLFMAIYMVWQGLSDPYVDNVAHIVGFISGIIYGFIYFHYYYEK